MTKEELEYELLQAKRLLKRAGEALDIVRDQKTRALRFQIMNFVKEKEDGEK